LTSYAKLACRSYDHTRRRPSEARWKAYKDCRREFTTQCKLARRKSWQKFTADQVSPKEAASLHHILQRQAYNKLGLICRDNGSLADSREESYQILMAEHFPGSTPLVIDRKRIFLFRPKTNIRHKAVTSQESHTCIRKTKVFSG
jgi:hypothetical protein